MPATDVSIETSLHICCICGLLRDQLEASPGPVAWITHHSYIETHGVDPTSYAHTHTYCPTCFLLVQTRVRIYCEELLQGRVEYSAGNSAGVSQMERPLLHH